MAESDAHALADRLRAEFTAVENRIRDFQNEAADEVRQLEERYEQFEALRHRAADEIFRPKLETLVATFGEVRTETDRSRDGGEVRLIFPKSERIPAHVELRLAASHDGRVQTLLLDYELSIIPVYMSFRARDRHEEPIADPSFDAIARWLDDRLVEFTNTYLSIQFEEQYQRDQWTTDPVANLRFLKVFAKGTVERNGVTHYFASDESREAFERDPEAYLT